MTGHQFPRQVKKKKQQQQQQTQIFFNISDAVTEIKQTNNVTVLITFIK